MPEMQEQGQRSPPDVCADDASPQDKDPGASTASFPRPHQTADFLDQAGFYAVSLQSERLSAFFTDCFPASDHM